MSVDAIDATVVVPCETVLSSVTIQYMSEVSLQKCLLTPLNQKHFLEEKANPCICSKVRSFMSVQCPQRRIDWLISSQSLKSGHGVCASKYRQRVHVYSSPEYIIYRTDSWCFMLLICRKGQETILTCGIALTLRDNVKAK